MTIKIIDGEYEAFAFPGGEVSVKVTKLPKENIRIIAKIFDSDNIMTLLLLCDAIKRMDRKVSRLIIPYFPYARQDRVCNEGEALSVKVMADLINSLNIPEVIIYDPHSDVTPALLNNCWIMGQEVFSKQVIGGKLVICPDAGAEKKIQKLKVPYVMATKVRDLETGEIVRTLVIDGERVKDKNCIIVDDICDGGRTFIELAKVLKHLGAKNVDLYITHGIFSKGFEVFDGYIDTIYYQQSGEVMKHEV